MHVDHLASLDPHFSERVQQTIWCSMATIDRRGRPRSRIVHPMWETPLHNDAVAFVLSSRDAFMGKHLAAHPHVSLSYWHPKMGALYVDCRADWIEDADEKLRAWELFRSTPRMYGYDPNTYYSGSATDPGNGVLRLTPWRAELAARPGDTDSPNTVWHAAPA